MFALTCAPKPAHRLLVLLVVSIVCVCLLGEGTVFGSLFRTGTGDLYRDLGVSKGATTAEIKQTFRKLARLHHPDLKETAEDKEAAKVRMASILRAYEVLSDDEKRIAYDLSGTIPGETPDPSAYSAEELFKYFHQQAPIFSRSKQLERLLQLHRLKSFRGRRLFLVQVYDDASDACRGFSSVWEMLYQSSLVKSRVVDMFRIDAMSIEGMVLLKELGISYNNAPYVFAIVDGQQWKLHGLAEAIKRRASHLAYQSLHHFVMNFFDDCRREVTSTPMPAMKDVLAYLSAPRSVHNGSTTSMRVLFPPITAETVPLTLQQLYWNQIEVRVTPRESLLQFVNEYCEMEVVVKDRSGDTVPMPDFMVVSEEALPHGSLHLAESESTDVSKSCRKVHIGSSVSLNIDKAVEFVESVLPPRQGNMDGVTLIDDMSFYQVCEHNCLVWLRPSCDTLPAASVAQALQENYLSFERGYICVDKHPRLQDALATSVANPQHQKEPVLVAITNGDDTKIHILRRYQEEEDVSAKSLYASLADLLEGKLEDAEVPLTPPLSLLLATEGFGMSFRTWSYIIIMNVYLMCKPVITNTIPFVMMYVIHKHILKYNDRGEGIPNEPQPSSNSSHPTTHKKPTTTGSKDTATATEGGGTSSGAPGLVMFTKHDISRAKEGKGFLLLCFAEGSAEGDVPLLPPIASDPRFTVRWLGTSEEQWKEWILSLKQNSSGSTDMPSPSSSLSKVTEVTVVAIRERRMMAVVKDAAQTTTSFLHDLLDGTISAKEALPIWAVDEES